MKLIYNAVSRNGQRISGEVEAKDKNEAASYLRTQNLVPTNISEKKESTLLNLPFFRKKASKELVFFTRQLSSMVSSGLTLIQSLQLLKEQMTNEEMREVIEKVVADVEGGMTFADALEKHEEAFPSLYVSLIRASEESGLLEKVLERLADNLEKQQKLRGTIKSALMYPAIVVSGMIVVIFIMMIFVVPQLTALYEDLDVPLPLTTQIVVTTSRFLTLFWPLILGLLVLGIFLFRRWRKTEAGKTVSDNFFLRIPVFGKLGKQSSMVEFTRTFGLLIGTGTLVVDALEKTAQTSSNGVYRNEIMQVARRVEKGVTIADSLSSSSLFPPIVIQMTRIGEETGKLDESLLKVSEYFEREVEETLKTMTTALEPMIMIALGVGVAFLIVSVITPIYSLTNSIQ